jgi:hypothetical protein
MLSLMSSYTAGMIMIERTVNIGKAIVPDIFKMYYTVANVFYESLSESSKFSLRDLVIHKSSTSLQT